MPHSSQNAHSSYRITVRCALRTWLVAVGATIVGSNLTAQETSVILGRVRGPDSSSVVGAVVNVRSLPDSAYSTTTTDSGGSYRARVQTSSTRFVITVTRSGFVAARREVTRSAGDSLRVDFTLTRLVQTLAPVTTRATRPRPQRSEQRGDFGPGQAGRISTANTVDRSDGLSGDMTGGLASALAMLSTTGVTSLGTGDPSISAFGMGADQNLNTLNGMTFGGTAQAEGTGLGLPRDGFRLEAVPATYDPAVGGFAGMLVSLRFPGGSDVADRSVHYSVDRPELAWTTPAGTNLGLRYGQNVLSGTASGPLSRTRFYNLSYQFDQRTADVASLGTASIVALRALGLNADSAARVQTIASRIGIPFFRQGAQQARSGELIARFDYRPQERPRTEVADQGFSPADNQVSLLFNGSVGSNRTTSGPLALAGSGLKGNAWRAGATASVSSFVFGSVLNELSLAASVTRSADSPFSNLPAASVFVSSDLPDGDMGVATLSAAGSGGGSSSRRTGLLQLKNQTAWYSWDRVHLVKISGEATLVDSKSLLNPGLGVYSFGSLNDFEHGVAREFSRTLTTVSSRGRSFGGAVGLSDIFAPKPSPGSGALEIQYGVRLEATGFSVPHAQNRTVDSLFGLRTDHVPSGWAVLPMVGFSKAVGKFSRSPAAPPSSRGSLFGGVREYQGQLAASSVGEALRHTGLATGVEQIDCVGASVPIPNWSSFASSPTNLPLECADAFGGTTSIIPDPSVFAYSRAFQPTRSWRGALGLSGALSQRLSGAISGTYAFNSHLPDGFNENFGGSQRFALASEGGRPVFVDPSDIVPSTGVIRSSASRRRSEFGPVINERSDLRGWSRDITAMLVDASGPGNIPGRPTWRETLAYTFTEGASQARGFSGSPTAGDPRDLGWVRSPRSNHKATLGVMFALPRIATISASGIAMSGQRFTPRVAGDINGDGLANDRPFVVDPNRSIDSELSSQMTRLLSTSDDRAKSCLERTLNSIAPVNACRGPWSFLLNLSISPDPYLIHLGNRGTIRLIATNVLGGLDMWLHGEERNHGWGPKPLPDANLLFVRGFSSTDQRFLYTVNPNFGRTRGNASVPARITIDARIYLGPDRETEFIRSYLEPARGAVPLTDQQIRNQFAYQPYTVFDQILALKTSLRLSDRQVDSITALKTAYKDQRASVMADLAAYLVSRKGNYRGENVRQHWHDAVAADLRRLHTMWATLHQILTTDQYSKLPVSLTAYWDMSPASFQYVLQRPLGLVRY